MLLSQSYWMHGRRDLADAHRSRAAELIEGEPPGRSVAWVLARLSARASLVGDNAGAIELASRAREVSQEIGWQGGLAEATNVRGIERVYAGDRGGVEDIVKSIELAHASGSAGVLARCLNTIAVAYQVLGEPGLGLAERLEALAVSEQVGSPSLLQWFDGVLADHHYRVGNWVEAARLADSFLAAVNAGSPNVVAYQVYVVRAELRVATGDLEGARGDAEAALLAGRGAGEVQALGYALSAAAHVFASTGASERAVVVARELLDALDRRLPDAVRGRQPADVRGRGDTPRSRRAAPCGARLASAHGVDRRRPRLRRRRLRGCRRPVAGDRRHAGRGGGPAPRRRAACR